MIINPDLFQEITQLADLLRAKFSPTEFIPGCLVKSVADKSQYATNNGWIEAVCGQHNQQRVRWKSNVTVAVNDFVDVLYFPDRRLFEAYGLGGAGAIAGAVIPDGSITDAKLADMPPGNVKGRGVSAGTGPPTDVTGVTLANIAFGASANGDIIIGDTALGWKKLNSGGNNLFLKTVSGHPAWVNLTVSETNAGIAEIATQAETDAGTDAARIVTPLTLATASFRKGFQGQASNYIITPSVAANDLTLDLKTLAGTDPTATDRIEARIGDTMVAITAALSVTANDGTNWFNSGGAELATRDVDYFVYLIQETGAAAGTKIGFARISYAATMANFVNTTTSQFYIKGNWTNFNATDQVALIGRFNATLGATPFNWSLTAASVINRPVNETRRLAFTSAISSQTGTITTVGTVTSSYTVVGRYFYIWQSIGITTNGTGATAVLSTIPLTPGGILTVMPGREVLVSGKMLQGYVQNTTTATWVNYDNSYPGASGANLACGGVAIPLI